MIEVHKTKGGVAASCIIKNGRLTTGQMIYCEGNEAKIKSLIADTGARVTEVTPSAPFVVLCFNDAPPVGARLSLANTGKVDVVEAIKEEVNLND